MQPAVPDDPRPRAEDQTFLSADDVGAFEQGNPFGRWALARYLVGRAVMSSVTQSLVVVAVVVLLLAAGARWGLHSTVLAVLLALVALGVLFVRWVLASIVRRFTDATSYTPVADRLSALVSDTHGDVLRELRRVGLPSHTVTLPLLAFRMIGRRRQDTLARLKRFETARVVPAARVDELHMLLRDGGPRFGDPGAAR